MESDEESELEIKVNHAFNELKVPEKQQIITKRYLNAIKKKDKNTYLHSLRTGILGKKIGEYVNSNEISDFFQACLLHDIGKIMNKDCSLKKEIGFNDIDREEMKKHSLEGYEILKEASIIYDEKSYNFYGELVLRHHNHSKNPYPKDMIEFEKNIPKKLRKLYKFYSKIIGIIDYYDSIKTRKNDFSGKKDLNGNPRLPTSKEAKEMFLNEFENNKDFILELYQNNIFQ